MCGIAGIIHRRGEQASRRELEALALALRHRGPDGEGFRCEGAVGFWHGRLSQLDSSPAAAQPAESPSGRYLLVFNGLIAGYRRLPRAGGASPTSDTTALLHALDCQGVSLLQELDGAYALALLDRQEQRVFLRRDGAGIRPLFYHCRPDHLLFASEASALVEAGHVFPALDPDSLLWFLEFQACPPGRTLFAGVQALEPGAGLEIRLTDGEIRHHPPPPPPEEETGVARTQWQESLRRAIVQAVEDARQSDHPAVVWLSGGLDSSLIALAPVNASLPVLSAVTSCYNDPGGADEREYARAVTEHGALPWSPVSLTPAELAAAHHGLARVLDTPAAGPSAPTLALARRTARHGRLCLTGSGGDELFAGYPRILAAAACLEADGRFGNSIPPGYSRQQAFIADAHTRGEDAFLRAVFGRNCGLLDELTGCWRERSRSWQPVRELQGLAGGEIKNLRSLLRIDQALLLPALLQVEDRLGMWAGLESRPPLLFAPVRDLAARIPAGELIDGGLKGLLREAVAPWLPPAVAGRRDKCGIIHPVARSYSNTWAEGMREAFSTVDAFGLFSAPAAEIVRRRENPQTGRVSWVLFILGSWLGHWGIRP